MGPEDVSEHSSSEEEGDSNSDVSRNMPDLFHGHTGVSLNITNL